MLRKAIIYLISSDAGADAVIVLIADAKCPVVKCVSDVSQYCNIDPTHQHQIV